MHENRNITRDGAVLCNEKKEKNVGSKEGKKCIYKVKLFLLLKAKHIKRLEGKCLCLCLHKKNYTQSM